MVPALTVPAPPTDASVPEASATTPTESSARTVTACPSSAVASVRLTVVSAVPVSAAVPSVAAPATATSKERLLARAERETLPVFAVNAARSPARAMTDCSNRCVLTLAPSAAAALPAVAASMPEMNCVSFFAWMRTWPFSAVRELPSSASARVWDVVMATPMVPAAVAEDVPAPEAEASMLRRASELAASMRTSRAVTALSLPASATVEFSFTSTATVPPAATAAPVPKPTSAEMSVSLASFCAVRANAPSVSTLTLSPSVACALVPVRMTLTPPPMAAPPAPVATASAVVTAQMSFCAAA